MKKLILVLGGGATKGFAHIGVLKVLEEHGIKPNLIVGTSMGAVIGGVYASGKKISHLVSISKKLSKGKLMDFNPLNLFWGTAVMSGKKLKKVLHQEIGGITHDQLDIPFIAVATDIIKGEVVTLKDGLVIDSVLASSAIPGVFPTVIKNGQILCDGGIINNVPDDIAKRLSKNNIILSVDVIADFNKQAEHSKIKIKEIAVNALMLMQSKMTKLQGNVSDLRLEINQPDVSLMNFESTQILKSIQYGELVMKKHITKLKKLLED